MGIGIGREIGSGSKSGVGIVTEIGRGMGRGGEGDEDTRPVSPKPSFSTACLEIRRLRRHGGIPAGVRVRPDVQQGCEHMMDMERDRDKHGAG